jgi:protein required for attachment to host cells
MDEFKRRFARSVAQTAVRVVQSNHSKNVIVAAQKRMLGFLRSELDPLLKTGVKVHDIGKDLGKLSPHEVHQYLAKEKLLPARKNPSA